MVHCFVCVFTSFRKDDHTNEFPYSRILWVVEKHVVELVTMYAILYEYTENNILV